MNVFIDIETIPDQAPGAIDAYLADVKPPAQYKKPESIKQWMDDNAHSVAESNWLKTSFDGAKGQICCICYAIDGGEVRQFTYFDSEVDIIERFNVNLAVDLDLHGHTQTPYFIGHYIKGFDLPFLFKRMVINGIKPSFKFKPFGRHGSDFYDTMEAWEGFKGSISLENLCAALGRESKQSMSGADVWPAFKGGEYQKISDYCARDVEDVRYVYNKINFIK